MEYGAQKVGTPPRVAILLEGAKLTSGERDVAYGPPQINLELAGKLKELLRQYGTRDVSPAELEALDMVCTKLSRVVTGQYKHDNYVDGATYFAIAGEMAMKAEGFKDVPPAAGPIGRNAPDWVDAVLRQTPGGLK